MRLDPEGFGMSVETDTRDKVIALGAEFVAFKREIREDVQSHGEKIDEMYELLTKARGIGWLGVTLLAVGGAMGGLASWALRKLGVSI